MERTIQELDANIKEAKKIADLAASLDRLRSNRDFKKVILDGYFEDEAIRLVHLKSEPQMQSPESQASIIQQLDAIGTLNQYFTVVYQKARLAQKSIEDDEQTREELLAEGVGE